MSTLETWFTQQQKELAIEVSEVGLSEMNDWQIIEEGAKPHHVAHASGRYHRGVFLKAWDAARNLWIERFLIAPIPPVEGEPFYGLALLARLNGKYLVQAKAEPGNATPGHVQLTSTIHASYTNIAMKLSGEIPFTWMYADPHCASYIVSQDGAQLYLKNNKVCFLELEKNPDEIPANYAWATAEEISSFAKRGLISEHLMQGLGASVLAVSSV